MSPTSISGGYSFGFQAVRISPASLKRRGCNEIFSTIEKFHFESRRYKQFYLNTHKELITNS